MINLWERKQQRVNEPRSALRCRGVFSMLKFLKCSQAFYRQKIFLPGMAGTVRIEQTHKTFFDCRIEVVVQKVFPVRQIQLFHHSLDRIRIIADRQYEFLTGGIFRNQLVGYLWGTCGVSSPAPAASGRSLSVLRSQYGAALRWEDRSDTWRQKAVHYRAARSSGRYPDWFRNKAIYQ